MKVFTDALDYSVAQSLENALKGTRFDKTEMCERVRNAQVPYSEDICTILMEELI